MKIVDELTRAWRTLPKPPRDSGQVTRLVLRPVEGERETPQRITVTPDDGVVGDRWQAGGAKGTDNQVTIMMEQAISLISSNDASPSLAGDNLFVTLDTHVENLPTGSRLRVGSALLEVTPEPHHGCAKFSARFGSEALKWSNGREHREQRLRGIHVRVAQAGDISLGDVIQVVSRG